jgi:hypothetical protein
VTKFATHAIHAIRDHDELARESSLRKPMVPVAHDLLAMKPEPYEVRVKPRFGRDPNRLPKDRHETRRAMEEAGFNRAGNSFRRTTQEMMFDSIGESIERQLASARRGLRPCRSGGRPQLGLERRAR